MADYDFSDFSGGGGSGARAMTLASKAIGLEKGMLGVVNELRQLEGPGPRETFEWEKEKFEIGKTFEMFTSLIKEPNLSDASRDIARAMMSQYWGQLPPLLQKGLAPWMTADFLSPERKKAEDFDKQRPPIQKPRGADGSVLERTAVNRMLWLEHDVLSAERERARNIAVWGKERGEAMTVTPQFFNAAASDDAPGSMFLGYRDKVTGQIGALDVDKVGLTAIKEAVDKGTSTFMDILNTGKVPEPGVEPQFGTLDGMQVVSKVTRDLRSGERGIETFPVGATKAQVDKSLPKELIAATMAVNSGDPDSILKNVKDPTTQALAMRMKELEGMEILQTKKGEVVPNTEFWKKLGQLQRDVEESWPGVGWVPFLKIGPKGVEAEEGTLEQGTWNKWAPSFLGGGGFTLGSGNWFWRRSDRKVTFKDLNGQTGTFHYDEKRRVAFDAYGNDVLESKDLPEGTILKTEFDSMPGGKPTPKESWWGSWGIYPSKVGVGLAQDMGRMVRIYLDAYKNQGEAAAKKVIEDYVDRNPGGDVFGQTPEHIASITGLVVEDVKRFLIEIKQAYRKGREAE